MAVRLLSLGVHVFYRKYIKKEKVDSNFNPMTFEHGIECLVVGGIFTLILALIGIVGWYYEHNILESNSYWIFIPGIIGLFSIITLIKGISKVIIHTFHRNKVLNESTYYVLAWVEFFLTGAIFTAIILLLIKYGIN